MIEGGEYMFIIVEEAQKLFATGSTAWADYSASLYCDCQDCSCDGIDTSCQCK